MNSFDSIEALPKWLGNLTSLIYLKMRDCKNLMYLPTVEVVQRLTKLGTLVISGCPLLAERCAKESGPEWHKISHIPHIREYLAIKSFDSMEALPEWLGNLTSLIYLDKRDCKNLMYLPTVEVMQRLTKLGTLGIEKCSKSFSISPEVGDT
ncbi:hypothetical protein Prudu_001347 [Prunus dulcis]|uniref:Uncharacterized protein n=1 Tax=Prunus dulcis TaxID=3755 RepID=A0A4Y1QNI0_PRUDU|nr:hypothetical protein Prudu_001347 [Prunus dulcis]